jgi:plasmid maintenance system antidote protein VapI
MKHNPPHDLLNYVIEQNDIHNDAGLARFLDVPAPVISNLRGGRLSFGPTYIIRLHEKTAMPVALIKSMLPVSLPK